MARTSSPPRHWLRLLARVVHLRDHQPARSNTLIEASYDRIANGYDTSWTQAMRTVSLDMLERLGPVAGAQAVDLTCGTGFVTRELARRTGRRPTGVDASAGMLAVARSAGDDCDFAQADILEWLRAQPDGSCDLVTCAWGLGYSEPRLVLQEVRRILRPGGRVGIVDNSLFSLAGVLWTSIRTFAERPDALQHVLRVRFLPSASALAWAMRSSGFRVSAAWSGRRSYRVPTGMEAIERLRASGAAAGFEFACSEEDREAIYGRFAELLGKDAGTEGIEITHRYLSATGVCR